LGEVSRYQRIARLHCLLWKYHDEKKWAHLKKTCISFLLTLGYSSVLSRKASKHIVKTFEFSDLARNSQLKNHFSGENSAYSKMEKEFLMSHSILKQQTLSPKYKIQWIKAYRHGNPFKIFYYLFKEHISLFGMQNFFLALRSTLVLFFLAYPAHYFHSWKLLTKSFEFYWGAISRAYSNDEIPPQF